jgi:hypothetical protein
VSIAAGAGQTRIVGLADFQRELRAVDAAFAKELRGINLDFAELAVGEMKAKAVAQGGAAAKFAPLGLVATAEQRRAKIRLDAKKAPGIFGAEFGSFAFRQFKPWTGNQWTDPESLEVGYFVHPTARELVRSGRAVEFYDERLTSVMGRAFPD